MCGCLPFLPLHLGPGCNPGMCHHWESNRQPTPPQVRRLVLNPLSHTSQGLHALIQTFIHLPEGKGTMVALDDL